MLAVEKNVMFLEERYVKKDTLSAVNVIQVEQSAQYASLSCHNRVDGAGYFCCLISNQNGSLLLRPKLPQHPQIILKQQPDIVNLVPEQHRAVNAHTKGVA